MEIQKSKNIFWTKHSKGKMYFYKLSESQIKRILRSPKRAEEGVAPDTIALMQPAGSRKNPYEIWVMVQDEKNKRKIISAWRYPGKTKPKSKVLSDILYNEFNEYGS